MRLSPFSRMNVVRKEEKETRLKEFILKDIQARKSAPADTSANGRYHLLALSAESPVAKALAGLKAELADASIAVDIIFVRTEIAPGCGTLAAGDGITDLRRLNDARLLDAHEQLVLGAETVWVGDCMRRDPAKRDAYECYSEGCTETAVCAMRSFLRLWDRAAPATLAAPERPAAPPLPMSILEPLLAAIGEAPPVTAATRH